MSARAINDRLHRRTLGAAHARDPSLRGEPAFCYGEPVLMLRNDYERDIYNGDSGLVLRVAEAASARPTGREGHGLHFMAVFPRRATPSEGFAAFHLEALRGDLELGYAMTVHKAQGSEFDHVALVLPDEDLPLLTREILYTALTRCHRSATIVGSPELLAVGASRVIDRHSGVAERIRARLKSHPAGG